VSMASQEPRKEGEKTSRALGSSITGQHYGFLLLFIPRHRCHDCCAKIWGWGVIGGGGVGEEKNSCFPWPLGADGSRQISTADMGHGRQMATRWGLGSMG
jgi:hypothetical protein